MSQTRRSLPGRNLSPQFPDLPQEVLLIEALPVTEGCVASIRLHHASDTRRQGLWLATEGSLRIAGETSQQFVIWADTAPPSFQVTVVETDGLLRFYNIWGRDGGLPGHNSQMYGSGMVRRELGNGWAEYSCANSGMPPTFGLLVFSIRVAPP